jgi:hypothetical protein
MSPIDVRKRHGSGGARAEIRWDAWEPIRAMSLAKLSGRMTGDAKHGVVAKIFLGKLRVTRNASRIKPGLIACHNRPAAFPRCRDGARPLASSRRVGMLRAKRCGQ